MHRLGFGISDGLSPPFSGNITRTFNPLGYHPNGMGNVNDSDMIGADVDNRHSKLTDERGASELDAANAEGDMDDESRSILRTTMFSTALADEGFERPMVLSWETARKVMTEKRLEILNVLGSDVDITSHRGLARYLDRNVSDVQDDLDILYDAGVIQSKPLVDPERNNPELTSETLVVNPILVNGEHLPQEIRVTAEGKDSSKPEPDT